MEYGVFNPHLPHIRGDEGDKFASDHEGTDGIVKSVLDEMCYSVSIHGEPGVI